MTASLHLSRENEGQVILEYALLLVLFLLAAAPGVRLFSGAIGDSISAASLHTALSSSPGKMAAHDAVRTSGLNFHTAYSHVTRKATTVLQDIATALHMNQAISFR